MPILNGFTFEELYEEENNGKKAWNNEIQYKLKESENYCFVTEKNFEEIKKKLDPNKEMYFLFSKDDNPNWDYQENLMKFMDRLHLG
jgi:AAA+ ATPase superfamily predicted ATPase